MATESVSKLIEYLLRRQFGSLAPPPTTTLRDSQHSHNDSAQSSYRRMLEKQAEYQAMPTAELRALAEDAKRADMTERLATLKKEEEQLFFNQPSATADFIYWAKMPIWSLDEAVALSLGKHPPTVNWESISMQGEQFLPEALMCSYLPKEYARRRELVTRAEWAHELSDPVRPVDFLMWAKNIDMTVPTELQSEVASRVPIADMRKELDTAKARIAELESELTVARDAATHRWPWGTYETEQLRRLAAAAQRFWVNYDPNELSTAPRSKTVENWLREQGVPQRVAQIMAQILRPDGLPTGPR